ncbi:MAG: CHASE2 domain-containing protein [Candidatus Methylumidiphilus sp.]
MKWFKGKGRPTQNLLGIALGLGAALLSLTPYASLLEEKIGLGLLFALRGEQPAPAEVVIVSIDRESASRLSVTGNAEQWPHRLHAEAIRRLHAAGAELIGFNIFFSAPQPQDDMAMAAAMRQTGAVVLANYLKLQHLQGEAYVESLEEPPPPLAQAALATVPFLLAQGEETDRFLIRYGENSDRPTFPLTLLRLYTLKTLSVELAEMLREDAPASPPALADHAAFFSGLDSQFAQQPASQSRLLDRLNAQALPPAKHAPLHTLAQSLGGDNSRYFNHYGPAGAIARIPYHRLFAPAGEGASLDLRGKIAVVGFAEDYPSGQSENRFFSPFSSVSSLELAATAVANLLSQNDIQPAFGRIGQLAWLLAWGGLIARLSLLRLGVGVASIAAATAAYAVCASWLFSTHALWLPLILPLFWLAPLGVIACLLNNYLTRTRENRNIHSVINRFIPEQAARRDDADGAEWESKLSFGVCLATDAGQYTALAETMKPMELGELMNDYYATLFPAVRRNGGWVSDVTGDAMMAVWSVPDAKADIRVGALRAALEMLGAVDVFQAQHRIQLPIRMGLHCGEMRVGFVGGKEHGAYRAVGDTVNTSARLEGLNKLLGTRILASDALVAGLSERFITRPMGRFILAGKSRPVIVHELLAAAADASPELLARVARFAAALAAFQAADWPAAAAAFQALAEASPEDGPSRFYQATAQANAANPLATPDLAAIAVSKPPPGALASQKA